MSASSRVRPMLGALAVYEVVCRHGSLTAAALELNIAQSAVSRHVAQLERRIGRALLSRKGNRLSVTQEGQRLASAIAVGLEEIDRALKELHPDRAAIFVLACSPDVAEGWLMPRFHRIVDALGTRQLRLLTSADYALFDAPDVDLSVRYGVPEAWPNHIVQPLFRGEWFPVAAPSLLERYSQLAGDSEDFSGVPLLHLGLDQRTAGGWRHWLGAEHDLAGPVFTGHGPMLQAALAGEGIALAWAGFVEEQLRTDRLKRVGTRCERSDGGLYLVAKPPLRGPTASVISALVGTRARS